MNYSTLPKSKFFNTGYLSKTILDEARVQQDLMSQKISNYCESQYTVCPCPTKPCLWQAGPCQRNSDSLSINYATPLPTYGLPPLDRKLPCLRYIQAP